MMPHCMGQYSCNRNLHVAIDSIFLLHGFVDELSIMHDYVKCEFCIQQIHADV